MLKALGYLVLIAVVAVGAVLGYASMQPDTFAVSRTATIAAPPDRIYPLIADFDAWTAWSPWEARDPAMERAVSGAPDGVGAVYAWNGNDDVGAGRMEIVEAAPPSKVTIKLDFSRPFEAHNTVDFTLAPAAGGTDVTWAMHGDQPLLGKVVGLFLDMDTMVGGDFEAGLARLKAESEK